MYGGRWAGRMTSCVMTHDLAMTAECTGTGRSSALQSNLGNTTTEGTGSKWSYFSGGLICQVLFKKFQSGIVHMPLREP